MESEEPEPKTGTENRNREPRTEADLVNSVEPRTGIRRTGWIRGGDPLGSDESKEPDPGRIQVTPTESMDPVNPRADSNSSRFIPIVQKSTRIVVVFVFDLFENRYIWFLWKKIYTSV